AGACGFSRAHSVGSFSASALQSTPDHLSAKARCMAGPACCHHAAAWSTVALRRCTSSMAWARTAAASRAFSFTNSTRCCSYFFRRGRSSAGTPVPAALSSALQNSGAGSSAAPSGAASASPSPAASAASCAAVSGSASAIKATASATSTVSGAVLSVSPSITLLLLLLAALLQPHVGLVGLDQGFEPGLHLGGDAGAPPGFLARRSFVGLAQQDLAHLGVN